MRHTYGYTLRVHDVARSDASQWLGDGVIGEGGGDWYIIYSRLVWRARACADTANEETPFYGVWVVQVEGRKTPRWLMSLTRTESPPTRKKYFELSDYSLTLSAELLLLIIWVSRSTTCSTVHSDQVPTLNEPNFTSIFTNTNSFQPFSNMLSPKVKRN